MTKKLEWWAYQTVKEFRWYVQPFWYNTRVWRTDGRTDGIGVAYTRYSINAVARKNACSHTFSTKQLSCKRSRSVDSYSPFCSISATEKKQILQVSLFTYSLMVIGPLYHYRLSITDITETYVHVCFWLIKLLQRYIGRSEKVSQRAFVMINS